MQLETKSEINCNNVKTNNNAKKKGGKVPW